MKAKALFLDVDGTLIPYDYDALPSDRVCEAIRKAKEKVVISLVTGRSLGSLQKLLKRLELNTGYAVVDMGSRVIDLSTKELLYDRPIERKNAQRIISLFHEESITFYLKDELAGFKPSEKPFEKGQQFDKAYMFYTEDDYTAEKLEGIEKALSGIPDINLYKNKHKKPGRFGLLVSHASATKLHGVEVLLKQMNIARGDTIGVGDSYNDFPLLMACGFKIAMGNAVDDLKAIADYVAPSVNDDGVADVIDRFVL